MKLLSKISTLALFAGMVLSVACKTEPQDTAFSISESEIIAAAEGVSADVRVSSGGEWIATTNVPWVAVSPVNGRGTVDCKIVVDTTAINTVRAGIVRFESMEDGRSLSLNVEQYGYDKFIIVSESEFSVPEYAETNKRMFDVEITSNVNFKISPAYNWVEYDPYKFELDRGARPRKAKVRFRYMNNTRPEERECLISFTAVDGSELKEAGTVKVIQKKAPPIENSRKGDSLAVVAIARAIRYDMRDDEGESMDKWDFVRLWNINDEGYKPELEGRLRYVEFSRFSTWFNTKDFSQADQLPYELGYLTTVEELIMFANSSSLLISLGSGELGKLTNLKRLTLYDVGLVSLDPDFANLSNLEYLDLSSNNFNELPEVLTPENFPKLKHLALSNNVRFIVLDLSNTPRPQTQWGGLFGNGQFPARLLEWENLEYLSLTNNYIHGVIPAMEDYVKYTENDEYILARGDTIKPAIGLPRVWPKMKTLRLNLNYMRGDLPDWLLYHPNLDTWLPDVFIFNQNSSNLLDINGKTSGFDNVPESDVYFYERYPLLNPDLK
jgi:hypothetical protein